MTSNSQELSDVVFRALIDSVSDGIVIVNQEGRIVFVNSQTERLFGYARAELLGQPLEALVPNRFRDKLQQHRVATMPGPQLRPVGTKLELHGLRKDGTEFPIEITPSSVQTESGLLACTAICGITERKRPEEALRQSEERFRLLVEGVRDYAIFMLDPEGYVTSWNPGAERIKGYQANDIVGQHFSRFYSREDVERGKPMEELKGALEKGRYEEEALRVRKDGSQFWASVLITPIYDPTGDLSGFAIVTRDITERKEAEEALARHAADLARSNEELAQFAYVASHDLQEPLRKIIAFGDRLSTHFSGALDEQGRDYLDRMQNAARRMEQLIESLLELSRVTMKGRVLEAVDLNKILSDVLTDLEVLIEQTGGRVEVERLPTLMADRSQMRQLLQNLIGNALKFHKENVPPVVRIRGQRGENGGWEIHVTDNGIGFEEKYVDLIFRPFQRLHAKNLFEGSGMGLAICNKIVACHSGQITAHSQPEMGSDFVVTLPARPEAKEAKAS